MRSITYIHDTWIVQEQRKEEGKKEFETYDEQRKCVIIDTLRDPCRNYGCQRRCRCRRQCWNVSGSSLNYLLTNHTNNTTTYREQPPRVAPSPVALQSAAEKRWVSDAIKCKPRERIKSEQASEWALLHCTQIELNQKQWRKQWMQSVSHSVSIGFLLLVLWWNVHVWAWLGRVCKLDTRRRHYWP